MGSKSSNGRTALDRKHRRGYPRKSLPLGVCFALLGAVGLAVPVTTSADDVLAGLDLWQTPPGTSSSDAFNSLSGGTPIPADFFDPGSDPFDGTLLLDGQTIPFTGNGSCLAPADTIVQRLTDAVLPTCPGSDTVPIEIVALNLVSTSPITVTFNGGQNPEQWTVRVCLSDVPQPIGSITINHTCPDGGDFIATLPVLPRFIFTRPSDGAVRIFDDGIAGRPVTQLNSAGGWVHQSTISQATQALAGAEVDRNCDGVLEVLTAGTSNFVPGIQPAPCICTTPTGGSAQSTQTIAMQATLTNLNVQPAQDPPDLNGNGIPDGCEPAPKVRFTKWLQTPHPDGVGFNVASDIDWFELVQGNQTAPNWVVADDFQSDGRPITCVRWWGSYLDPVFEPVVRSRNQSASANRIKPIVRQHSVKSQKTTSEEDRQEDEDDDRDEEDDDEDDSAEHADPASTQLRGINPAAPPKRIVMPGSIAVRTSLAEMQAFHAAHPNDPATVVPFQPAPLPQELGQPARAKKHGGRGHQPGQHQGHSPAQVQLPLVQGELGQGTFPGPSAPALLNSFSGVLDNQSSIPPDTMGAVGPHHVVELINTGFTVFAKNGVVLSPQVSLRSFFSSLGTGAGQPAEGPFDPKILYDQYVDRWVVTADGGGSNSWVLVGISRTNDPTAFWNLFGIQANIISGGANHTNHFADYPGLGLDPNNIIVTNNMFGVSFVHADVWVIDKAAMIAGTPLALGTNFSQFHNPGNTGAFTFRPCHTYGQTAANAVNYILDQGWSNGTRRFFRSKEITGTGAAAVINTFGGSDFLEVLTYDFFVNDATQPAGCNPINTIDTRLLKAVWRNGKVWTTHNVGGIGSKAEVAWYELDPTTVGSQALAGIPLQQGHVSDPSLAYYYPSIAVNQFECVALGFSASDANTFVSAYYTARDPSVDPPNTMQPVALLKAGVATYNKDFGSGRNRWGDYSATVVDPADDITFWTLQEYAETELGNGNCGANTGRWSTWWGSFTCLANTGACCFHDGTCTLLSQSNCTTQGGRFQGVGVDCASANCPVSQIDGWLLSFHTDLPAAQNPNGFSQPQDLLGLYFCPASAVTITPTGVFGWDGHQVFEFFAELDQCHLIHSLPDPRPGATPTNPATPIDFQETNGFIYWLDVQAVVGHSYVQTKTDLFGSQPLGGGSGVSRVWEITVPGGPDTVLPNQPITALSGLANVGTHLIGVTGFNGGGTIHTIGLDGVEISSRAPTDPAITALASAASAPATAAGFTAGHVYAVASGSNQMWDLGLDGNGPDTLHAQLADANAVIIGTVDGLAFDSLSGTLYGSAFDPFGTPHLVTIAGSGLTTDLGEILVDGVSLGCGNVSGLSFHAGTLYGSLGGGGSNCSTAGSVVVIPSSAPALAFTDHSVTGGTGSISALTEGFINRWVEVQTSNFAPNHFWGWHTSPDLFSDQSTTGDVAMGPNGEWLYQNWQIVDGTVHNLTRVDQAFELLTPNPPPPPSCLCLGDMDGNSVINGLDIQGFIDCLLGSPGPGTNCACADMDGSGTADILDVTLFSTALLNMTPCP